MNTKQLDGVTVVIGSGTYESSPAPQLSRTVATLANGGTDTWNIDFGTLGLKAGYYQLSVSIVMKRATTGDYRELRFAFSALWNGTTLTLMATPSTIAGNWNSAGLAGVLSAVSTDNLRIDTTNSSSEAGALRIHVSFGRQDLIS